MAYLSVEKLKEFGFKSTGKNIKISDKASIYYPERMEIGDNCQIDDFCLLSGKINIGRNVHIAPFCMVSGGVKGITFDDFSGLSFGVKVFTQSDDFSGQALTNPTVPEKYKKVSHKEIIIGRHCIIGTASVILPGVTLDEGTAIGAMSLVRKNTDSWSIYTGNPAKKIMDRSKVMLEKEKEYLKEIQ